jgi:hypothetical protein
MMCTNAQRTGAANKAARIFNTRIGVNQLTLKDARLIGRGERERIARLNWIEEHNTRAKSRWTLRQPVDPAANLRDLLEARYQLYAWIDKSVEDL